MSPRIAGASLLLLVFCTASTPQESLAVVRDWLPSTVGDRWIYAREIRGGDRDRPDVERWEQEDVIVAIETVPQGTLIRRKVDFKNGTRPPRWRTPASGAAQSNILVHQGCV